MFQATRYSPLAASTIAGGVAAVFTAFRVDEVEDSGNNSDYSLRHIWATCLTAKAAD